MTIVTPSKVSFSIVIIIFKNNNTVIFFVLHCSPPNFFFILSHYISLKSDLYIMSNILSRI